MKVSHVLNIIADVAGVFLPAVQTAASVAESIEQLVERLKNSGDPKMERLGAYTESLAALDPNADITVEDVEAARLLLNPQLEPEP